jgi:hypothetical protein
MDEQVAVKLIEALAKVWKRIRELHPDVPPVVLIPAPALRRGVLGHFAPLRWQARSEGRENYHEVVVVAEHLNRKTEDIVETLIHEAAHAMNFARGIKDCSTTSQYHNEKFKRGAEELGLTVEKVANYGWAFTKMPGRTEVRYVEEISILEAVLLHRQGFKPRPSKVEDGEENSDDAAKPKGRNLKATCSCPFIIRVSQRTILSTTIRCANCGEAFRTT